MNVPSTTTEDFAWYKLVPGSAGIQQGDFLNNFPVPVFPSTLADVEDDSVQLKLDEPVRLQRFNVVVATQSCDLVEPPPDQEVIVLPRYDYSTLSKRWSNIRGKDNWGNLVRGRVIRAHLLSRCEIPNHEFEFQVVDLQTVFSLSFEITRRVADKQEERVRLLPPYREHLAQAFGKQFTRIGLPIGLPSDYPY